MSRAHDNSTVHPEEQANQACFEDVYNRYRHNIYNYIAMKVNPGAAEDLTQQVFLKAMENLQSFHGKSGLFTWLFKIAQNTVKNEFRSLSRKKELLYDFTDYDSQTISLDFAKYVEIRLDISHALTKLKELDQQIIVLRFFVDCPISEVAVIVGMRESAVKNRLYRALEKLKKELKEWGDIAIMSIQEMISIVNKNESESADSRKKVHNDLMQQLKKNVDRLLTIYEHQPSQKIIIEIYPDLPTFHRAVGEADAPNWFMGTYSGNVLKIVSPLNPGPEHTYESILKSTIHLFAMWLIHDVNPHAPKWLRQGIGGFEAKQMAPAFIQSTTADAIRNKNVPTFRQLNDDTWGFGSMKGFQFSYLLVSFILQTYGTDALNKLIRTPDDFMGILRLSESELYEQWVDYLTERNA